MLSTLLLVAGLARSTELSVSPSTLLESARSLGEPASGSANSRGGRSDLPAPIMADGSGLPAGQGKAADGEDLYVERCADCHGLEGQGGSAMELVGDPATLATEFPDRGIAAFWPYAPPLFDYVRRAMPPEAPWSLSADDTYAVVAWLLQLNGLIEPDQRVDADLLSTLPMPNRDGFHTVLD